MEWHALPAEKLPESLGSSKGGLDGKEAEQRIRKYGFNELERRKNVSAISLLLNEFRNPLVYLLVVAAVLSFAIGEQLDSILIGTVIIVNAALGFAQDWKAEKAIEALTALFVRQTRVLRGGKETIVETKYIVPGDILILEAGDAIAADGRVIDAADFKVNEAPLTGESLPVTKTTKALPEKTPLPDRKNMAYAGTMVMNGWAKVLVTATGMSTEIGRIAGLTLGIERGKTPTEKMLESIAKKLMFLFVALSAFTAAIGIYFGKDMTEMILVAISLMVAAVPEGLPAVVTIVFAIGLQRLSRANTLVRKLSATETLGAVTFICTDKTGTLTKNQMTAEKVFINGRVISDIDAESIIRKDGEGAKTLRKLFETGVLCNHASIEGKPIGDPTEIAILMIADNSGITKAKLDKTHRILGEISFNLERKMMSVITQNSGCVIVNTKGAPERVLERCSHCMEDGKITRLDAKEKKILLEKNEELAADGYRLLAVAYRELESTKEEKQAEEGLVYLGSLALADPLRPETKDALSQARDAGIKVAIVTGDHKNTAVAIAKQIDLFEINSIALDGTELDGMDDSQLEKIIYRVKVFARVNPEQKMRVLKILQKNGEIVAMTGDGVNDAPALKKADIGIAMGKIGTDVARETADVILLDDNFASIIKGISEGRGMFLNIKKFVQYMVSCNTAEILILFFAMLLNWPLILFPFQILWVNLVTDSITALSLGLDPKPKDIMKYPPKRDEVLGRGSLAWVLFLAAIKTLSVLAVFYLFLNEDYAIAVTMAFGCLIFAENFNLFNFKDFNNPLYKANPFDNIYLILSFMISMLLTAAVIQLEFFNDYFRTVPLDWWHWGLLALFGSFVLIGGEIYKNARCLMKKEK
ncbi:cation-translocating P-type ATPase [Candidatus Micrarchaeota archaeon]|nr:cation-translocating P-type ATPase [Candidatus Micrarchaeota archaeon]